MKIVFFIILSIITITKIDAFAQGINISADSLDAQFLNPPISLKPYVWWHWMGTNFSEEGITKDLEAMKASGIGGATIFNISSSVQETHSPILNNPWPDQTYRSPAYWKALRFAASEAKRLGLKIGLQNTAGYATTGGPWIDEKRGMQKIVWSITEIKGDTYLSVKIPEPERPNYTGYGTTGQKAVYYHDIALLAIPDIKNPTINNIIDLSSMMNEKGILTWDVPDGKWTVYRIGYSPTGANPHPLPDELIGHSLEADKMSAEQSAYHWEKILNPLKEHLGDYIGKSFDHILIDSYEAGFQNWTPFFREEFIKRKGYDPVPWILCFGQVITNSRENNLARILGNEEQTKRFEWDFRDVINQLYFDNGWKIGKQMINNAGLKFYFEPYGIDAPFSTSQGVALTDLPMGEFWTWGNGGPINHIPSFVNIYGSRGGISDIIPAAARAAGKNIVGAEAFTSRPEISQWAEDPTFLKLSATGTFASGANKLFLHEWVHQPFDEQYQPGMCMGWWGTHFSRYQTWFEPGKAFFTWLGRCQAMLQYGEQISDYLSMDEVVGCSDVISESDFLNDSIKVVNSKIVLPSGRSYPFMVFPDNNKMLPEIANKARDLVSKGATIVARKPVSSPSLKNYPKCDQELATIADELWGDGKNNFYKKGLVLTELEDAIRKYKITPDSFIEKAKHPEDIKVVHRHKDDLDIYFVANLSVQPQYASISFRVSGKQPEIWHAENGSVTDAPLWDEKDGRCFVDFNFQGTQSIFVVFRRKALKSEHPASIIVNDTTVNWNVERRKEDKIVLCSYDTLKALVYYSSGRKQILEIKPSPSVELTGPWNVSFIPKQGKPFEYKYSGLADFRKCDNKDIKFFSGTAIYKKEIMNDLDFSSDNEHILLDLGILNDIAEISVNGKSLGVLWFPPYIADITNLLKAGKNTLEIAVTNNWANRLIGDEQEPSDFELGIDRENKGSGLKEFPEWFIRHQERPSKGRKTFSVWHYFHKNSLLQPAGLVGPVRMVCQSEKAL